MADTIHDLTTPQLAELVKSLTTATRVRLIRMLPDHIEWTDGDTLGIEELDIEAAENGDKPGFVCPHCDKVFRADRLNYLDLAVLKEEFNYVDFGRQVAVIDDITDVDDIKTQHIALLCPECDETVALPPRWDHEHE